MENGKEKTGATEEPSINMVGVIKDRKFIPYGMTGVRGGIPVYVFATYEDYEAAAPTLPEECMIVTLDDLDTGGFEFDSETSETSENALQNKTITAIIKTMDQEREILSQQAQGVYEGRNLADVFDAEISRYSNEWEWIKDRNDTGFYKGVFVADFLQITISDGQIAKLQIAGIETHYRTTDQNIGSNIDFISKDCLNDTVQWRTTSNNNGTANGGESPYYVSNIRSYLVNIVYPKLPESIKSVISDKRTIIETRYSADGQLTDSNSFGWTSLGKLWVPSEYEVFGSVIWGTRGYSGGQHVQYPLFANSYKHRIKGNGDGGERCSWWLSTVSCASTSYCCEVSANGLSYAGPASTYKNFPICFRISQ